MHRINFIALRELYQTLPAAQKLIAMLADQDPPADWVTVDELEALDLGRRNAVDLLKALDEHGVGEFRVGRKGHPSRLVWVIDPQQLVLQMRADGALDTSDASESHEDADDEGTLLEADDDAASEDDEDEDQDDEDEEDEPRPQLALALQQELDRRMSKLVPAPVPTNGRSQAKKAEPARAEPSKEPARVAASERPGELIEHVFVLRPNHTVRLALPTDLSAREAAVLGDWVRNLSFERG
jgi:hypothetical protein